MRYRKNLYVIWSTFYKNGLIQFFTPAGYFFLFYNKKIPYVARMRDFWRAIKPHLLSLPKMK